MERFSLRFVSAAAMAACLAFTFSPAYGADEIDYAPAVLNRCKAATAFVDLGEKGSGSAFLVHSCGLFATNRHVVSALEGGATLNGAKLTLILHPGEPGQKVVPAHVVAVSETEDLALLKADEPVQAEPLPLGPGTGLAELSKVVLFGYPFGKMLSTGSQYPEISVNAGRISSLRRSGNQLDRIQLDAAANPGNSGGPLLDRDGKVIGVIVSGIHGANVNFAIPAEKLRSMLQQPILSMRVPQIRYAQRHEPVPVEAEIVENMPVPPDSTLTLRLGADANRPAITLTKENGLFRGKGALEETGKGTQDRLRISAGFGGATVGATTEDLTVHAGNRALKLSEIWKITRDAKSTKATLIHLDPKKREYESITGKLTGLPQLRSTLNGVALDLADANWVRIGKYNPGAEAIPYELALSSKGHEIAKWQGKVHISDRPFGIAQGDDAEEPTGLSRYRVIFSSSSREEEKEGVEISALLDAATDAKKGTWTRGEEGLSAQADADAWCELPAIPEDQYRAAISFTPQAGGKGEILLHLPLGGSSAVLHVQGDSGKVSVDAPGLLPISVGDSKAASFEQGKPVTISINARVENDTALLSCRVGDGDMAWWMGRSVGASTAKENPVARDRIAIGTHGLGMTLTSVRLVAPAGRVQILRELPSATFVAGKLIGRWSFDYPVQGGQFPSGGVHTHATVLGTVQTGIEPAAIGAGAMRLSGKSAGYRLEDSDTTNTAWHSTRTNSMWFRAVALDKRRYIYDEGGKISGYAIFLENGKLWAGGWDTNNGHRWKGTWLSGGEIAADKWYHAALVLASGPNEKKLTLYVNGRRVAQGWGNGIGSHSPIAIGTTFGPVNLAPVKSTPDLSDDPEPNSAEPAATGADAEPNDTTSTKSPAPASAPPSITPVQFEGELDEVQIYNDALDEKAIRVLAGGVYRVK